MSVSAEILPPIGNAIHCCDRVHQKLDTGRVCPMERCAPRSLVRQAEFKRVGSVVQTPNRSTTCTEQNEYNKWFRQNAKCIRMVQVAAMVVAPRCGVLCTLLYVSVFCEGGSVGVHDSLPSGPVFRHR